MLWVGFNGIFQYEILYSFFTFLQCHTDDILGNDAFVNMLGIAFYSPMLPCDVSVNSVRHYIVFTSVTV